MSQQVNRTSHKQIVHFLGRPTGKLNRAECEPHVDWSLIGEPGVSIGLGGRKGQGKTTRMFSLVQDLHDATAYFTEKELIVARDTKSFEFLNFTNYGYKIQCYIPVGTYFKPNLKHIKAENFNRVFYDPDDLKGSLFSHFLKPNAQEPIHLIQFDCFAHRDRPLQGHYWLRFVNELADWKQSHKIDENGKVFRIAVMMDEFQQISKQRRDAAVAAEMKRASAEITDTILDDFRKSGIRLVAVFNPFKNSDPFLRTQFDYVILQNMTEDDLPKYLHDFIPLVEGCGRHQSVVINLSQSPRPGFNRIDWPIGIPTNINIEVEYRGEIELGVQLSEREKRQREAHHHAALLMLSAVKEGHRCPKCNATFTDSWGQVAAKAGWRGRQHPYNYVRKWLIPDDKMQLEIRPEIEDEIAAKPPIQEFLEDAKEPASEPATAPNPIPTTAKEEPTETARQENSGQAISKEKKKPLPEDVLDQEIFADV